MRRVAARSFVGTALIMMALPATHAAPYEVTGATVTDIGTLGGQSSMAYDINHAGNIVGWAHTVNSQQHAFLYAAGTMYDLIPDAAYPWSEARGINYHDQVVGTYKFGQGTYAFRWGAGVFGQLRTEHPQGFTMNSNAVATSDSGYIVGQLRYRDDDYCCYYDAHFWVDNDRAYPLHEDTYPLANTVADVNVYGVAVGHVHAYYAYRWRFGIPNVVREQIPTPAVYGHAYVEPSGINSSGAVVGTSCCGGPAYLWRAWYWDGVSARSAVLDMPGQNSNADDINDQGFIAGYSERTVTPPFQPSLLIDSAFLYHRDFGAYFLPQPPQPFPWLHVNCRAHALNERKSNGLIQVVGYCANSNGMGVHAVRWDVTVQRAQPIGPLPWP